MACIIAILLRGPCRQALLETLSGGNGRTPIVLSFKIIARISANIVLSFKKLLVLALIFYFLSK